MKVTEPIDWESDLRVGGKRNCKAQNKMTGQMTTIKGEYLEIDPPRVLAFTWEPSWEKVHPTVVRIELTAIASGTRVLLTHSGWGEATQARSSHEQGWPRVLGLPGGLLPEVNSMAFVEQWLRKFMKRRIPCGTFDKS